MLTPVGGIVKLDMEVVRQVRGAEAKVTMRVADYKAERTCSAEVVACNTRSMLKERRRERKPVVEARW